MNIALWIGQGLLAVIFVASGTAKSTQSRDRMLATGQTAAKIVPLPLMRVAGVSELFGVLGVILPWATGVARVLTPVAATGLAVIMMLAATVHGRLREPRNIAINMAILALAVFVAWGRFADL
ncbi:MAG TPA: DoxX family protein [Actinophytocola sp.]|uniref:DoxX family protein n=1 Tax=Actinophytocola sp. TaxID=1872138 RepID=UPI002DDD5FE2|nr:DoxX family protein [Actinophytocola sp.]HEV2781242.1 DoxX family protein [Actinophytocola sp.]